MLFIPIATTFRYGYVQETFGYCYPNREWFIQAHRRYDPWDNVIPSTTEGMSGFRFVPTTTKQTNEKLKKYLKKEMKDRGYTVRLPDRMLLRGCKTYGMVIDDNHRCYQKVMDFDSMSTYIEPKPHVLCNRPIYNRPGCHISVGSANIAYADPNGLDSWWYAYKEFDYRKYPNYILKSARFEVNCLLSDDNKNPRIVRWFLSIKYDPKRKEIDFDREQCFQAVLRINSFEDGSLRKPYRIYNAAPFGSTELNIDEVYGASTVNATKLVDFLVKRFFTFE